MKSAQFGPARIRTDDTNPFAHHTMRVRVPAILEEVLDKNPDFPERVVRAVRELVADLKRGAEFERLSPAAPFADSWLRALDERASETWLGTDWFFAETYCYRQLIERCGYWHTRRDPFRPHKLDEYQSPEFAKSFARALDGSSHDGGISKALLRSLFGNRIDLSFAAARQRGLEVETDGLLVDDREQALALLSNGTGPVHIVLDNAGTELMLDLVLVDTLLQVLACDVVLHVKAHPTFVSDATVEDVREFLTSTRHDAISGVGAFRARLSAALASSRLSIREHAFWNGPAALWALPDDLIAVLSGARLVVLKGDANYRRALNDALWPAETPFSEVTAYFPAPLLALRTLKSDAIVGLTRKQREELERLDPKWRTNGKRGVISLGGTREKGNAT